MCEVLYKLSYFASWSANNLIMIYNKIGPSTDPWEIPRVTSQDDEDTSSTVTLCTLFVKKDLEGFLLCCLCTVYLV